MSGRQGPSDKMDKASEVRFSVVVPVGPGWVEVDRLRDTLDSLAAHEDPASIRLILVDDSPIPRRLADHWPSAVVIRTALWETRTPDPLSAHIVGTLEALRRAGGDFVLKLDTDAVVIAPFAQAIAAAFRRDGRLGIVGAFEKSPQGAVRDWSAWPRVISRTTWAVRAARISGRAFPNLGWRPMAERRTARNTITAAAANPEYSLGAHCLGGAYAVSANLFKRSHEWDWNPFVGGQLGEDITLGLHCGASGMRMRGMVDEGEPFGVSWIGLPGDPESLVRRRFSIVHSVKDCEYGSEHELRAWFRAHCR
jgi:hypothetical protein